jgi:hypothetical protein
MCCTMVLGLRKPISLRWVVKGMMCKSSVGVGDACMEETEQQGFGGIWDCIGICGFDLVVSFSVQPCCIP